VAPLVPPITPAGLRGVVVPLGNGAGKVARGACKISGIGMHSLSVYQNDVACAGRALATRVLYKQDKETGEFKKRLVPSEEMVESCLWVTMKQIGVRMPWRSVEIGLEEYPEYYSGARRTLYQNVAASLARAPFEQRDAWLNAFVKVDYASAGSDPRLIQTRSPRYHLSFGRYIKANEKAVYGGVDQLMSEKSIVKGLNASEIGQLVADKFSSFTNPVAIGIDASRFDGSVSTPVLKLVHRFYRDYVCDDEEFLEMCEMQLVNTGRIYASDGLIKYTAEGGIMSGDVDTSLKGCLIMCTLIISWARRVGVEFKMVNNGDDCVVIMDKADECKFCDGMQEWFASLGFDIICEPPVYEIEHIEFCQARPVLDADNKYKMCRNPFTAITKDSMARVPIESQKAYHKWLKAVGDCGMALAGDMPIFSALYRKYQQTGGDAVSNISQHKGFVGGLQWLSAGMKSRDRVTDDTRMSYWEAWGIEPHNQLLAEQYYHSINIDGALLDPIESDIPDHFHASAELRSLLYDG